MILTRLSRALREQNWFAVAIEFVIVVAGVLLAFQFSLMSQQQAERARVVAQIELVVRGVVRDVVQRTMTAERRWDVGVVRASGTASTYELDLSEVPLVVERRDRCF